MDRCSVKDRPEDVAWLNSLSHSEIDMLVALKLCIHHRAEMMGHEELAEKFDLKMLRAIACVLMEHLQEKLKESSVTLDGVKADAALDACNLLKFDHEVGSSVEDPPLKLLLEWTKSEPASKVQLDTDEFLMQPPPVSMIHPPVSVLPGSPKKLRKTNHCSICGKPGHKKSTCKEAPSSSNPQQPIRRMKRHQNQSESTQLSQPSQQPPIGRVDEDMGMKTVFNPGRSSKAVIEEGTKQEYIHPDAAPRTKLSMPNEKEIVVWRGESSNAPEGSRRRIHFGALGTTVSQPSKLPFKPLGFKLKVQTLQLQARKQNMTRKTKA